MLVNNPRLVEFMRLKGLDVSDNPDPREINEILQEQWYKAKEGLVRADLTGKAPSEEDMVYLREFGLAADDFPKDDLNAYKGIIILGATLKAVAKRIKFVDEIAARQDFNGVWPEIFLLGSVRPVRMNLEMPDHLSGIEKEVGVRFKTEYRNIDLANWPKDEIEVMRLAWHYMEKQKLPGISSVISVKCEQVDLEDGQKRLPNTADTIKAFFRRMRGNLETGRYLAISSQPYNLSQDLQIQRTLRDMEIADSFQFETVGPAAAPLALDKWLDTLTKMVYEEVKTI